MKTTLQVFCEAMGWQSGTIHQARERFAVASHREMDRVCSRLSAEIANVSDPATALEFMKKRSEALRLHHQAIGEMGG